MTVRTPLKDAGLESNSVTLQEESDVTYAQLKLVNAYYGLLRSDPGSSSTQFNAGVALYFGFTHTYGSYPETNYQYTEQSIETATSWTQLTGYGQPYVMDIVRYRGTSLASSPGDTWTALDENDDMQNTWLEPGTGTTNASDYTATVDVVTRTGYYNNLAQWVHGDPSSLADIAEEDRPLYRDANGDLRRMTLADIDDTFIKPAILLLNGETSLALSTEDLRPYTVASGSTPSGYSVLNAHNNGSFGSGVLFQDTRADEDAYVNTGLLYTSSTEKLINRYFLFRKLNCNTTLSAYSNKSYDFYRFTDSNDLQPYTPDQLASKLINRMSYYIAAVDNYRIRFRMTYGIIPSSYWNGERFPVGSLMRDTRLDLSLIHI